MRHTLDWFTEALFVFLYWLAHVEFWRMMEKICSTQHCLRNCVWLQIPMTFFLSFNHIVNKNLQFLFPKIDISRCIWVAIEYENWIGFLTWLECLMISISFIYLKPCLQTIFLFNFYVIQIDCSKENGVVDRNDRFIPPYNLYN